MVSIHAAAGGFAFKKCREPLSVLFETVEQDKSEKSLYVPGKRIVLQSPQSIARRRYTVAHDFYYLIQLLRFLLPRKPELFIKTRIRILYTKHEYRDRRPTLAAVH